MGLVPRDRRQADERNVTDQTGLVDIGLVVDVLPETGSSAKELVLGVGKAAEFGTRVRHWFGSAGAAPAEVLSIFGRPGESTTHPRRWQFFAQPP